eukprot:gene5980-6052_t
MVSENRPRRWGLSCRGLALVLAMALAGALMGAAPVGHGGPVRAVAVGAGHVVSGGFDGSAIVWPEGVVLRAHDGAVNAVAVAGDGSVVTGGADGHVLRWRDGAVVADMAGHDGPVAALAVEGGRVASASWDGTARVWMPDGAVQVFEGHSGPVNAVAFAPGGRLVTAGYNGGIRVWAADGSAELHQVGVPQNAVAVAADGEIVAGGADGVLRLLRLGDTRSLPIDATPITALSLSADGGLVAVVTLGGVAMVVDRRSLAVVTVLLGTEHPLWAVAFDGDGVVTGGAGRVVRRWDAGTGRLLGGFGAAPVADALPAGDRGAQVFRACSACHALGPDDGLRAGPSLHGLFGRRVGSVAGFGYSAALRQMDLVWSADTVSDLFDRGPQAVTPGTRMPEQRIADPADRAALIATFNINNVNKRLDNLLDWLERSAPDVACLQELKAETRDFPIEAVRAAGYEAVWQGERRWNGVAILARGSKPVLTRRALPGDGSDAQARYIEAAVSGVLIGCLYLPNGNPQPGPKFAYKLAWFERLIAHAQGLLAAGVPVVLAGDYNVVPTDRDIYRTKSYARNALLQPASRAAFQTLLDQGWTDAIRALHPDATVYTFWDYLREAWPRDAGLRLDHLLLSPDLMPRLCEAGVDRWVRNEAGASDHAPAWVTLQDAVPKSRRRASARGGRTPSAGRLGRD